MVSYAIGTPRQRILKRWAALKNERASRLEHWRDISDQILPWRSRFLLTDRVKSRRNDKIINATPSNASRILEAGMMAGITSPARPWFRFTTPDKKTSENGAVKEWMRTVEEVIRDVMLGSNLYNSLQNIYADLGAFGTAVMHIEDDDEDVIRAYVWPVGQYALANSARLQVQTVYRECFMTVEQLVEKFGYESLCRTTQALNDRGDFDQVIEVLHVVQPNKDLKHGRATYEGKPWTGIWLETSGGDDAGFLQQKGFEEFPLMCPRWNVTGEDVYGNSPGMTALGDCRELQKLERRKAQLFDKVVNPPMVVPTSLMHRRFSLLPGDVIYADIAAAGQRVQPAMEVVPGSMQESREAIREVEERINETFYARLWMMAVDSERSNITATEIAAKQQEKMMQLGPVLERLQDELLEPMIDRIFAIVYRRSEVAWKLGLPGLIPEPPDELRTPEGAKIKVEYISILAQAQKAVGITAMDRYVGFVVQQLAPVRPDALDNLNVDEICDGYLEATGAPSNFNLPKEQVAAIRQAHQQQAQAQQQGQAMLAASQGAKNLSQADTSGDNGLTRLLGNYGDGQTPQAAA